MARAKKPWVRKRPYREMGRGKTAAARARHKQKTLERFAPVVDALNALGIKRAGNGWPYKTHAKVKRYLAENNLPSVKDQTLYRYLQRVCDEED
jgi:hypothetical protein